jgi:hypothetical protein
MKKSAKIFYLLIFILVIILAFCFSLVVYVSEDNIISTLAIKQEVFGYSREGREITGYEIGSGENCLLMFGAIHGNERGTADVLNSLVDEIKANPGIVSKTKKLIIIPLVNVDGYNDQREDKLNASGVNIDLNFGTPDWQSYGPGGDYAGPKPFSENESRMIKQVVEKYKPTIMISFHAFGAFVSPEPDENSMKLAQWYADKTGYYEYYNGPEDYPGTSTKWFMQNGGKAAIVVETSGKLRGEWDINKGPLLELVSSYEI